MRRQSHSRHLIFTKSQIKSSQRISRRTGLWDGHSFKQNMGWFQVFAISQLNITSITAIISRFWRTLTKVWKWLYIHTVSFFWSPKGKRSSFFLSCLMILLCKCKQLHCSEKKYSCFQYFRQRWTNTLGHFYLLQNVHELQWKMLPLKSTIDSRADFHGEFRKCCIEDFFKTPSLIKKKSTCSRINWKDPVSRYWSGNCNREVKKGKLLSVPLQYCNINKIFFFFFLFLSVLSWRKEPCWCKLELLKFLRFIQVEYFDLDADIIWLFIDA